MVVAVDSPSSLKACKALLHVFQAKIDFIAAQAAEASRHLAAS